MQAVLRGERQRQQQRRGGVHAPAAQEDRGMTKAMADERLMKLQELHRKLDVEVTRLERRAYLTPTEQRHMVHLKKEKLRAKDEIVSLRRA
jgi:uncharacterized protein YdcH (DUF465 family)